MIVAAFYQCSLWNHTFRSDVVRMAECNNANDGYSLKAQLRGKFSEIAREVYRGIPAANQP